MFLFKKRKTIILKIDKDLTFFYANSRSHLKDCANILIYALALHAVSRSHVISKKS